MNYDEARAEIREQRQAQYGSQWMRHLDRFGPEAYFFEMAGILGRLEDMMVGENWDMFEDSIQDKLLDIGNYASFVYDWIEAQKAKRTDQEFRESLP